MERSGPNPVAPPRRKKKLPRSESDGGASLCSATSEDNVAVKPSLNYITLGDLSSDAAAEVNSQDTLSPPANQPEFLLPRSKNVISDSKPAPRDTGSNKYQLPPISPSSANYGLSKSVQNVSYTDFRNKGEALSSKENIYLESVGSTKDPSLSLPLKSPPIKTDSESPKQKPARPPERPRPFASQGGIPKRSPSSKSSPSTAALKSAYTSNRPSGRVSNKSTKEDELTIIDSREKAIVRKYSRSDEDGNQTVLSPTTTTRFSQPTTTRQSSVKEWLAKGKQETTIAALGVRSKAQSLMKKVKSSALSKSGSSSNQSKGAHQLPERPPRPAPPVTDGPIYETVKNAARSTGESSSSSSNYSYVDVSPGWWRKGSQDKTKKWATLPASRHQSAADCVHNSDGQSCSSLYTQLTPRTIDDDGAYEDMKSFSESYSSSLRTDPSPALSAGHLSSDSESPVTTAKHLLSIEHNEQGDEEDYMFMSSITLDEPSLYMDVKHHTSAHTHPSTHKPDS